MGTEEMAVNGRDKVLGWEIGVCRDGEKCVEEGNGKLVEKYIGDN